MTSSLKNNKLKLTKSSTVFLDSSIILSGLASLSGGSRKILDAGEEGKLQLVATPFIIQEVANNMSKLQVDEKDLKTLLATKTIHLISDPPQDVVRKCRRATPDPNDAPIIAGAVFSGATVLVSLDKTHILTQKVRRSLKPIKVFSPKQFWRWVEENSR